MLRSISLGVILIGVLVLEGNRPVGARSSGSNAGDGSMVRIEGGSFLMGSDDGPVDEKPMHSVQVNTFEIDRTEVTVAAYQQRVKAGACSAAEPYARRELLQYCNAGHPDRQGHPINCVSWEQARSYCASWSPSGWRIEPRHSRGSFWKAKRLSLVVR
jgi:formylglycine-generating enzyme required for sulfatase activity